MTYERPKIKTYEVGDVRKYAQLKRDGIMLTLKTFSVKTECLTRHPDGAHDIADQLDLDPINLLSDSMWVGALFCELFSPGEPASQVKSHIASGDMSKLKIECFAAPSCFDFWELEHLEELCEKIGMPFVEYMSWPDYEDPYIAMSKVFEWFHRSPGYEGLVLKNSNLNDWCKWKPVLTCDLVILGFKDGAGKFLGTLGSLTLGLHDGTFVCNCSGMDDATRDYISENEDKLFGTVCEVSYQRRDSGGGLRHPRFARFRDDKTREECVEI